MIGPKDKKQTVKISSKPNHAEAGYWKDIPDQFIFGKGTAREVTFITNSSLGRWTIYNYGSRIALRAFSKTKNNPSRRASIIVDLTKAAK